MSCKLMCLLSGAHTEEFKKKQKKSHMSFNLKYFTDTSCKATECDTTKVQEKTGDWINGHGQLETSVLCFYCSSNITHASSFSPQIISHNTGRQSRNKLNQKAKKAKKDKKPESLFTEEEFQQFQREYFGSRK